MKNKTLCAIVTSFLICLFAVNINAQPQLTISENKYDFGSIPQHVSVSHTFWLKSTGSDTLRIIKVIPGCSCTKMPLEKTELAPGDSTALELIFNSKSYNNSVRRSPQIMTNASDQPYRINFIADVYKSTAELPFVFEPTTADDKTELFKIVNNSEEEQTIKLIDNSREYFDFDLPEKIAGKSTAVASVSLVSMDNLKKKSFTIEVTGNSGSKRYTVPVSYEMKKN